MSEQLLASPFLFRFSVPCLATKAKWTANGVKLGEEYSLPSFMNLDRPDGAAADWAELRFAWSRAGLAFHLRVQDKRQPPWCRESRAEDSDGLHLWIDTRDTKTIHRAGRFCHRFAFLPAGGGRTLNDPVAALVGINRAKENPRPAPNGSLHVRSEKRVDGYLLQGFIGADAMTGFDPAEHPRLGFYYAVIDREKGWRALSLDGEFPVDEDPSLWPTLELM